MTTPSLFWFPGSCSRVAFVALKEVGEPFDVVLVNRLAPPTDEYLALNPKNKVPVLVTPERTVTENPAILTYLHRRHPDAHLLPAGTPDVEIDVLETLSWFAAGIHPYVTRQRLPYLFSELPESYPSIRAIARKQLEEAFGVIEQRLAGRDWLFGEWSVVDAYLLWLWFRAAGSGMDGTLFPRCAAHAERCERRPSVAHVLEQETAELAGMRARGLLPPQALPDYQVGRAPRFDGAL